MRKHRSLTNGAHWQVPDKRELALRRAISEVVGRPFKVGQASRHIRVLRKQFPDHLFTSRQIVMRGRKRRMIMYGGPKARPW